MPRTRTPAAGALTALALTAAALLVGPPASAADDPEAAVDQLIEIVSSGDFTTLDRVVCGAEVDAVRERFDIATSLGIPAEDGATEALVLRIEDAASETIEVTDETARVRLTGTLSIAVEEGRIRDLVRQMLEAEGSTVTDEQLDLMVPMMESAFSQRLPLDEELEVILEDGAWRICDGTGTEPDDPAAVEPSISFDGLCGLVPLSEVNALGEPGLTFDSSDGAGDHCTFSSTTDTELRTLTVSYTAGGSIDDFRSILPDGTDLSLGGSSAYASGDELLVEVADGILQVSADFGAAPPDGLEPVAYLSHIAELYLPVLPQVVEPDGSDGGEDGTAVEPQAAFCDLLTIEQLNQLSGLDLDEVTGGATFCSYSSTDPATYALVGTSLEEVDLDDLKVFLPDGEDLSVAGLPAYWVGGGQLWVAIPDTATTLGVSASLDAGAEGVDALDVAVGVAELLIPAVMAGDG